MLSPARSSSCSPVLSDGPDFLAFAVNQLSVDDESEFLFPVVEDGKFSDGLVNARDQCETKEEFQRLENGASQDSPAQSHEEKKGENSREETPSTEPKTNSSDRRNEQKSSTDDKLPNSEGKKSAVDLNTGKMSETSLISDLKIKSKRAEGQGSFKELGAVTKSAAIWRGRVFTESPSNRIDNSLNRNKRNSVRKLGDCSLLRNMPHNRDNFPSNHRKLGLYDIATNLCAKKRETDKRDSTLKSARYFSLAGRSGSKWLQNTVRSKKTELPPIDVVSRKRYSAHWIPQKSIPLHGEVNVLNEYSNDQRDARKQSDSNSIVLKSVLETLEATHLGGQNTRVETLKHSLASLSRNNNQANFEKKALPLVKSALAFKHHGNKSA